MTLKKTLQIAIPAVFATLAAIGASSGNPLPSLSGRAPLMALVIALGGAVLYATFSLEARKLSDTERATQPPPLSALATITTFGSCLYAFSLGITALWPSVAPSPLWLHRVLSGLWTGALILLAVVTLPTLWASVRFAFSRRA